MPHLAKAVEASKQSCGCGQNKETREAAYRAIDALRDANILLERWERDADLALMARVYKHGFGNHEPLRKDKQFPKPFIRLAPIFVISIPIFYMTQIVIVKLLFSLFSIMYYVKN